MKRSLLALAALSALTGVASAQSSVTLFGVIDLAGLVVDNGSAKSTKSLSTDGLNSSRLGVRGIEDLGGGLRAGFWLEGGMGPDTGCGAATLGAPLTVGTISNTQNQGTGGNLSAGQLSSTAGAQTCIGQNWQRRSTVSLLSNFGEIRLGRDYTPTFWNLTVFDPFGTNGVGNSGQIQSTLGSGALTAARASNTIGYFLPSLFGGLYGQAMVAAGEGVTGRASTSTGNKYYGGRIGYAAGPVNVAVAYGVTDKTGSMVDDLDNVNLGASYNFGFMTVQGYVAKYKYSIAQQKHAFIGVLVPLGSGTLRASYGRSTGNGGTETTNDVYKATMYAAGYVYDLSKRTAIYATYSYLNNAGGGPSGGAAFVLYGPSGAALNSGPGRVFLPGETSKGGQIGVRHSF